MDSSKRDRLPGTARRIAENNPAVWEAFNRLGKEVAEAGPLSRREMRLVKIALAMGIQSEGAVHSHARRGRAEGLSEEDLHHVAVLAIPTIGFPRAAAACSWLGDDAGESAGY